MDSDSLPSRISLRDIAKKLGLSHSTISMALRDHPRISAVVREKIHATALEMGYRPDPMLTALAYYRKNKGEKPVRSAIAWLNCWENPLQLRNHREFDLYWTGASVAANKFGYHLDEFSISRDMPPKRLEAVLLARGIKGVLLPPRSATDAQPWDWTDFHWEYFSVVRFGRSWASPNVHLVTSDQVGNTLLALEKMRERGYRRIGFVTASDALPSSMFKAGYLVGQSPPRQKTQIPPLILEKMTRDAELKKLGQWIKKHTPDAILTDMAALRGILNHAGYQIPKDIGLAAESVLDGNADAGIYQNPEEIGRVAFLVMMSLVLDNALGVPPISRQVFVSGAWVDGSTLPWRKDSGR